MKIKNKADSNARSRLLLIIPLLVVVAIAPLIVYLKIIPVDKAIVDYWNNAQNYDYFSYYKSILIIAGAALSMVSLIIGIFYRHINVRRTFFYIPVLIFAAAVIISSITSGYRNVALYGFPDRYEGLIVWLSYLVIMVAAANLINHAAQVKLLTGGLLVSSAIIGIVGVYQFFSGDGTVFGTLYNPNTLGMYMSMLVPVSTCLFILSANKLLKVLTGALTCLLFANLIASGSRGSYIAFAVSIIILALFLLRRRLVSWKYPIVLFFSLALVFAGLNLAGGGAISARIGSTLAGRDIHIEDSKIDKIKDLKIEGNRLSLICTNSVLKVETASNQIAFSDEKGNSLGLKADEKANVYSFKDSRYAGYTVSSNANILRVQKGKSFMYFAITDKGFRLLSSKGKVIDLVNVDTFGFKGHERFASGRGFIWSRTLPLLKSTLLIGHGPDTFAMYFPQNDYLGKLNYMYDANIIIDKPHDMYLQMAVNTGVLSLVAFLVMVGFYCFQSIKILLKSRLDNIFSRTGLAVFAAVTGYLVSGLSTDSAVSVAPVFWVLLGLGISLNYLQTKAPALPAGKNGKKSSNGNRGNTI